MIPDCPCGGEIKTDASERLARIESIPDCPCGGEIKTDMVFLLDPGHRYQIALVGARSKHWLTKMYLQGEDTRLPLWGRDQNRLWNCATARQLIPDCPCGGEIKTWLQAHGQNCRRYQIALVGARSKLCKTKDPNAAVIPDCPCGGEIKARAMYQYSAGAVYQLTRCRKQKTDCTGVSIDLNHPAFLDSERNCR